MAAFYAEENFREPVNAALRLRGHDVLTCLQDGQAGRAIADDTVLARAYALGRVVLTQNCNDFRNLHRSNHLHCGIVNCSYDPDAAALAERIEAEVNRQAPGGRWLIRISKPNLSGRPPAPIS